MKRYIITEELKSALRNGDYSLQRLGRLGGFQVKNLLFANKTISEVHLEKISKLFNQSFQLPEASMGYEKNLGTYATSPKFKKLEINEDLAEFIGIMLGDGHLHEYGLIIAFDKRNVSYIAHVRSLFQRLLSVQPRNKTIKKTNQGYLYFYSKNLAEKLTSFGLAKGDKIKNRVGIPQWIKENDHYSRRCLRGLVDTDGCVYKCKRERQTYVKFTNFNPRLLEDFRNLALKLGYHFANANEKNVCLYRKDEVLKFINDIKPLKAIGDIV